VMMERVLPGTILTLLNQQQELLTCLSQHYEKVLTNSNQLRTELLRVGFDHPTAGRSNNQEVPHEPETGDPPAVCLLETGYCSEPYSEYSVHQCTSSQGAEQDSVVRFNVAHNDDATLSSQAGTRQLQQGQHTKSARSILLHSAFHSLKTMVHKTDSSCDLAHDPESSMGPRRCIADPQNLESIIWGKIIALCVLYTSWIVPFTLGFDWWRSGMVLYIVGYVVEGIFWFDMLQSFRTAFIEHGRLVRTPKEIAKHYLQFWFWIDLLANIPWETLVSAWYDTKVHRKTFKIIKWAKLPKLLRLSGWRKVLDGMGGKGQYTHLIMSCLSLCIAIHMACCSLVGLIGPCHFYPPQNFVWKFHGDVKEDLVLNDPSLGWQCLQDSLWVMYLQALHVGAGILLGNYAPIEGPFGISKFNDLTSSHMIEESTRAQEISTWSWYFAVATAWALVGIVLCGMLMAQLARLVLMSNWREMMFWLKCDAAERELEHYGDKLPVTLQHRIRKHFQFRFRRAEYGPLQLMDSQLVTRGCRTEIAYALYSATLTQVDFIHRVAPGVLGELCVALDCRSYMPGDFVYRVGEEPAGLCIVETGQVACIDLEGNVTHTVTVPEVFGDTMSLAKLVYQSRTGELAMSSRAWLFGHAEDEIEAELAGFCTVDAVKAMEMCSILHLWMPELTRICARHPSLLEVLVQSNRSRVLRRLSFVTHTSSDLSHAHVQTHDRTHDDTLGNKHAHNHEHDNYNVNVNSNHHDYGENNDTRERAIRHTFSGNGAVQSHVARSHSDFDSNDSNSPLHV